MLGSSTSGAEARMTEQARAELRRRIAETPIILLMKGSRLVPLCGYSAAVVAILDRLGLAYDTIDVAGDRAMREAARAWTGWPTFPQLVAHGRFIGGLELLRALDEAGALAAELAPPAANSSVLRA
jgi:monothiol glutaredoxin